MLQQNGGRRCRIFLRLSFFINSLYVGTGFVPQESCRLYHRLRDRSHTTVIKSTYQYDIGKNVGLVQTPFPSVSNDTSQGSNRKSYHKIIQFLKAGTRDIPRIAHSMVGLSSILVGLHHMSEVLIISSFTNVSCGASTKLCSGCVHTLAGLLGIRRLNFKSNREAARNAMFWPAPIQSFWLASATLTEWGQGSDAQFSMFSSPYTSFTTFNLLLTFWQLSEIIRKTGSPSKTKDNIWFKKSSHNAILVEFSYLLWMQLQMGAALYIARFVPFQEFSAFMDAFPKMQTLLSNLALNTAFFNNLAVFIATLLRYKLVSNPRHYNKIVFSLPLLSSIYIVWKVLSCFFFTYDGAMSSSFISMIIK